MRSCVQAVHKSWPLLEITFVSVEKEQFTLFAHMSPQALQSVLGPSGPRRIIGVAFSLIPQCRQLAHMFANYC